MTRYAPRAFGGPVPLPLVHTMSGTESLVASDSGAFVSQFVPTEASTGSDVGGNNQSGVDSGTLSDLLLVTNDPSPGAIESNVGSDSALQAGLFSGIEANTGTDSLLSTDTTLFVESNTGSDSLLDSANTSFIESNSGADTGGSQQGGVDSGTVSDALLATNDPSPGFVESNVGSDSTIYVASTLFVENNTGSDSATFTDNITFTEANTASDVGGAQQWGVDASTGSDVGGMTGGGADSGTATDALLATDNTGFTESDPANDTSSTGLTQQSAGVTTNNMNGEEDLVGSDVGGMTQWGVEALSGSDAFTSSSNTNFTEGNTGSDSSLNSSVFAGIEALIITDSALYVISPILTDANSGADTGGMNQGGSDSGTASDSLLAISNTSLIENTTGSDNLLYSANTLFVENNTGSDSALFADNTSFVDATTGTDINGMSQSGVESLIGTDSLAVIGVSAFIDNATGSDVGPGLRSWLVDALSGSDVGGFQSWLIEALSGTDAGMFTDGFAIVEALAGSDSGGFTQQSSAPAFSVSFRITIPASSESIVVPSKSDTVVVPASAFPAIIP